MKRTIALSADPGCLSERDWQMLLVEARKHVNEPANRAMFDKHHDSSAWWDDWFQHYFDEQVIGFLPPSMLMTPDMLGRQVPIMARNSALLLTGELASSKGLSRKC